MRPGARSDPAARRADAGPRPGTGLAGDRGPGRRTGAGRAVRSDARAGPRRPARGARPGRAGRRPVRRGVRPGGGRSAGGPPGGHPLVAGPAARRALPGDRGRGRPALRRGRRAVDLRRRGFRDRPVPAPRPGGARRRGRRRHRPLPGDGTLPHRGPRPVPGPARPGRGPDGRGPGRRAGACPAFACRAPVRGDHGRLGRDVPAFLRPALHRRHGHHPAPVAAGPPAGRGPQAAGAHRPSGAGSGPAGRFRE